MIRSFSSVVTDSLCPFPLPTLISNLFITHSFIPHRTSRFSHSLFSTFSSPTTLPFVTANAPFTLTLAQPNFTSCSIKTLRMKPHGNKGVFCPSLKMSSFLQIYCWRKRRLLHSATLIFWQKRELFPPLTETIIVRLKLRIRRAVLRASWRQIRYIASYNRGKSCE